MSGREKSEQSAAPPAAGAEKANDWQKVGGEVLSDKQISSAQASSAARSETQISRPAPGSIEHLLEQSKGATVTLKVNEHESRLPVARIGAPESSAPVVSVRALRQDGAPLYGPSDQPPRPSQPIPGVPNLSRPSQTVDRLSPNQGQFESGDRGLRPNPGQFQSNDRALRPSQPIPNVHERPLPQSTEQSGPRSGGRGPILPERSVAKEIPLPPRAPNRGTEQKSAVPFSLSGEAPAKIKIGDVPLPRPKPAELKAKVEAHPPGTPKARVEVVPPGAPKARGEANPPVAPKAQVEAIPPGAPKARAEANPSIAPAAPEKKEPLRVTVSPRVEDKTIPIPPAAGAPERQTGSERPAPPASNAVRPETPSSTPKVETRVAAPETRTDASIPKTVVPEAQVRTAVPPPKAAAPEAQIKTDAPVIKAPADFKLPAQDMRIPIPGHDTTRTPEQKAHDIREQHRLYNEAQAKHVKELDTYWERVDKAKASKETIKDFPPIYKGPEKPTAPLPPPPVAERPNVRAESEVLPVQAVAATGWGKDEMPSLNDLLSNSKQLNRWAFKNGKAPEFRIHEVDEETFKQRYAEEALRVGAKNGLTAAEVTEQIKKIYAFENGGRGTREFFSGMDPNMLREDKASTDARRAFHPTASTAIGYTQVLISTTLIHIDQKVKDFTGRMNEMAAQSSDPLRAKELQEKAKMVEGIHDLLDKELGRFASSNKGKYLRSDGSRKENLYQDFAKSEMKLPTGGTAKGLSRALHALNLDGDIGPINQTAELDFIMSRHKLLRGSLDERAKVQKERADGYDNLPAEQKQAAIKEVLGLLKQEPCHPSQLDAKTREFTALKNGVETKLIALKPGVSDALAKKNLTDPENDLLASKILTMRRFGENTGELSPAARALLDKVSYVRNEGTDAAKLLPAAVELANLAGLGNARGMLQADSIDLPTTNYFARKGYERNPVAKGRSADELLMQIHRIMNGPNGDRASAAFEKPFRDVQAGRPAFDRIAAQAPPPPPPEIATKQPDVKKPVVAQKPPAGHRAVADHKPEPSRKPEAAHKPDPPHKPKQKH